MRTNSIISFLLYVLFIGSGQLNAQVAINTDGTDPNPSAMLDVKSTTGGLLIPRLDENQISNISNPAQGLLAYDISNHYFVFYDNGKWNKLQEIDKFSFIADDDDDTRILLEETADEDVIHFYTEGTKHFSMSNGRLEVKNTGKSVFIGEGAGAIDDLSNNNNTLIGHYAGNNNTTGEGNASVGYQSLYNNTEGSFNTAIGNQVMNSNTVGEWNTGMGSNALNNNSTGNKNVAIGVLSMYFNQSGLKNTAIGTASLYSNTMSSNNVAIGDSALHSNGAGVSSGEYANSNVAVGSKSMSLNTLGSQNAAIGSLSLYNNTKGQANTAMGFKALYSNDTSRFNTGIGERSLENNLSGEKNTSTGSRSLQNNTIGSKNSAFGMYSLRNNLIGSGHTAVGYQSLHSTDSASNNTAIGNLAGYHAKGDSNIFIGNKAGYNETGDNTLYIDNSDTINPLIKGYFSKREYGDYRLDRTVTISGRTCVKSLRSYDSDEGEGVHSDVALEIRSKNKTFVLPRVDNQTMLDLQYNMMADGPPPEGSVIYNTTLKMPMFFDGSNWKSYTGQNYIGEVAHGGVVFYLDGNGGGLVCNIGFSNDQSVWGCYGNNINGANGTAIGTGLQNTLDIVSDCSDPLSAARICYDFVNTISIAGVYSDWYLPSIDELQQIYQNKAVIYDAISEFGGNGMLGGSTSLWSSSEYDSNNAWSIDFSTGASTITTKVNSYQYFQIRSF